MAIDRRILSILYANGISDVNKVQEFLGEKNNYYEVKINDEIKKLRIPGYTYNDVDNILENVIESVIDFEKKNINDNVIDKLISNINLDEAVIAPFLKKEEFSFEEELEKSDKENEKLLEEIKKVEKPKVEKPKVEKPKVEKPKVETPKKNTKKSKDDFDDFINLA